MNKDEIKKMTVEELLKLYPSGFAISPTGALSKTIKATSHLIGIINEPLPASGGYLIVKMISN